MFLSLAVLAAAFVTSASADYNPHDVHNAIIAADSAGHGLGELGIIIKQLKDIQNISMALYPWCQDFYIGDLDGTAFAFGYTGVGFKDAAICMQNFLAMFPNMEKMVYMGTSGWSPQRGGVLNAPYCSDPVPPSDIYPIGSVCIGASGTIWDGHMEDWVGKNVNDSCTYLGDAQHDTRKTWQLAGATIKGDEGWSKKVQAALKGFQLPTPAKFAVDGAVGYWSALQRGAGQNYNFSAASLARPVIVGVDTPGHCLENGGYAFWRGAPFEQQCRIYSATPFGEDPADALCVSAMEAPGWLDIVVRVNALRMSARAEVAAAVKKGESVPFHAREVASLPIVQYVNVRGNSDYAVWPIYREDSRASLAAAYPECAKKGAGCAQLATGDSWGELDSKVWLGSVNVTDDQFRHDGFGSAIASASAVALEIARKIVHGGL